MRAGKRIRRNGESGKEKVDVDSGKKRDKAWE